MILTGTTPNQKSAFDLFGLKFRFGLNLNQSTMYNDFYFLLAIVNGIIQITMVICFFITVGNVSKIRQHLTEKEQAKLNEYKRHKAFGRTDKAREALEEYVWARITFYKNQYLEPAKSKSLAELRNNSEPELIAVGSKWPE